MNDEIIKMLNNINSNETVKVFETELQTFEKMANSNTNIMYKEIYRKIIEDYKKDPKRGLYGGYSGYSTRMRITTSSFSNYDCNNNINYLNIKGDLAKAHNDKHEDKIYFYTSIENNNNIIELTFNSKKLEQLLKEDGFNTELSYMGELYTYINAKDFRDLIEKSKTHTYKK